jgi:hypothetical protein
MRISEQIEALRVEQRKLSVKHDELGREIRKIIDSCPHTRRATYTACGIETARCVECGNEVFVRDLGYGYCD